MPRLFGAQVARRYLGLKNLADYVESRSAMLGIGHLPIRTVLDIGANKGRESRRYRRRFPDAQVIAVEPIPELAASIAKWAKTQAGKVEVHNVALAEKPGNATFCVNLESSGWSSLGAPSGDNKNVQAIPVRVETLDRITAGMTLQDDVLVKIDTEGGDLNVIRGGERTLRQATAVIVESWFYPTKHGDTQPAFEDISRALSDLGFCYRGNLRCAWRGGVCDGADALFVRRSEAHRLAA